MSRGRGYGSGPVRGSMRGRGSSDGSWRGRGRGGYNTHPSRGGSYNNYNTTPSTSHTQWYNKDANSGNQQNYRTDRYPSTGECQVLVVTSSVMSTVRCL